MVIANFGGLFLQFGSIIDVLFQLENLGFFAFVLPFLLVFTIVFAGFERLSTPLSVIISPKDRRDFMLDQMLDSEHAVSETIPLTVCVVRNPDLL